MIPVEIPPPPIGGFFIGPVEIRLYAICILTGIFVGGFLARKRFVSRGGDPDKFDNIIFATVLMGIVGARLYHVIIDHHLYFGPGRNPWQALNIRNGGLGIWGGVIVGGLTAWLLCRRYQINFAAFADVLAPGVIFAQVFGRLGNYFNQELFGRPTELPWALQVEPRYRPEGFEQFTTFHPTFAYEMGWNAIGGFVLLWIERRFKLGRGKLITAYVLWYALGRFGVESLRIDPVMHIGPLRVNAVVTLVMGIIALLVFLWLVRNRPGVMLWPFGLPTSGAGLRPAVPRPSVAADHTEKSADNIRDAENSS